MPRKYSPRPRTPEVRERCARAGGQARAAALSPERRKAIARAGYQAMIKKVVEATAATSTSASPAAEPSAA